MISRQPTGERLLLEELPDRWRDLREAGPVRYDETQGVWQVLDHAGVATVLADPATYSSDLSALAPTQSDFETFRQGNFVGMDPPEHRKLRTLVSQAFTPRVVQGLGPRIEAVCARLLDAVADRDRFDLVDALAYPLPIIVIAELLGIPAEEHRLFQEWASVLFGGDQLGEAPDMADLERALEAIAPTVREMNGYMLDHIRARRAHPGDDLTSRLIAAEVDGVRLADQEMVGFVALLLVAGHITTTALLGNAVVTFDRHPGTDAALRADPARIPAAVEEVLRWLPPFPELGRRVTRPVVLGGRDIPAGTLLMAHLGAANRDPARFDTPDVFDAARNPNPHLTFGHGIHFCFGAPLARLEARIALRMLHERFRILAIPCYEDIAYQNPAVIIGVRHLPVEVGRP
ncbi:MULTISPECIES: cytochrome P450 [Streptomyces]|uniref:Cytochrome P450 n=1 Tax=Streptomyces bangladeshensis TaxID=295352 RepID=A0ABP5N4I3_9ACTN|nr:cytochrome P450 [Streptomyces sp. EAS-AB2608]MYU26827.1 cytochrome P450 [Streptomyces sp. SID7810]BCM65420.1 putative cytochrome P450 [Streptomyces sp. EAS-AB2608]CUW25650.1 Erythromycin C-12 hydroxylase [Streptomyces reticuli]